MATLIASNDLSMEDIRTIIDGLYHQHKVRDILFQDGSVAYTLAKALGVKVKESKDFYGINKQTCLKITKAGAVTAIVPADQPEESKNFTLGMALGFYVLHYLYEGKDKEKVAYSKSLALPNIREGQENGSIEATTFRQANLFAQCVAMPEPLFYRCLLSRTSTNELAERFHVPLLMAAIRRRDLLDSAKK